jgi:hypothetical protein
MVPEVVPKDGTHSQIPEHVTDVGKEYVPGAHALQDVMPSP